MRTKIIFLSLLIVVSSCSTLDKIKNTSVQKISDSTDIAKFNGNYKVLRTDHIGLSLEDIFNFQIDFNNQNRASSEDFIKIEFINNKKLKADLYSRDTLRETRIIKGKIRKNYFIMRSSFKPKFYGLFNGYKGSKSRIALLEDGNITADNSNGGCGMIVIIPIMCAGGNENGLIFERKKASR